MSQYPVTMGYEDGDSPSTLALKREMHRLAVENTMLRDVLSRVTPLTLPPICSVDELRAIRASEPARSGHETITIPLVGSSAVSFDPGTRAYHFATRYLGAEMIEHNYYLSKDIVDRARVLDLMASLLRRTVEDFARQLLAKPGGGE